MRISLGVTIILVVVAGIQVGKCLKEQENLRVPRQADNPYIVHEIIPDVINEIPEQDLLVEYASGSSAQLGNELVPADLMEKPTIQWTSEPDSYYTLLMVDPDLPSRKRPDLRQFIHWLVGNIPGTSIESGQTISEYVGLAPPLGTGLHRYVTLVYKQPTLLEFDEPYSNYTDGRQRAWFSVQSFTEKYALGSPLGGNFFQAQYDESVPMMQFQLGMVLVDYCPS